MNKARSRLVLAALLVLVLFSVVLAGGLAGCGEKSAPEGEENTDLLDQGNGGTGLSNIALVRDFYKVSIVNPDGSGERRLTNTPSRSYNDLAFSPNGKKLAAIKTEGDTMPGIVIIDVGDGGEMNLYLDQATHVNWNTAGVVPWFGSICWAGESVLYLTTTRASYDVYQVARLDLSTQQVEVVVENAKSPSLSPDGKKLAYIALPSDWARYGSGAWVTDSPGDLTVRDLASGSTQKIAVNRGDGTSRGYVFEAVYSPDAKHMAAVCSDEPDTALYYTDLTGKILSQLHSVGPIGVIRHPSFSPDGSKLVDCLETWVNGPQEAREYVIYTMETGGSTGGSTGGGTGAQTSLGAGRYPSWSP